MFVVRVIYNFAYLFLDAQCFYGNRVYNSGESFPSSDGCNACFCSNGVVGCTWRLCPPAGIAQKIYFCFKVKYIEDLT